MHAMVYHVPRFMKIHKGIKKFTGQGKLLWKIIINAASEMELVLIYIKIIIYSWLANFK